MQKTKKAFNHTEIKNLDKHLRFCFESTSDWREQTVLKALRQICGILEDMEQRLSILEGCTEFEVLELDQKLKRCFK